MTAGPNAHLARPLGAGPVGTPWGLARRAAISGLAATLLLAGCASPPPPAPPAPPPAQATDQVLLLPQADGKPSALLVSRGEQQLLLNQPYATATLQGGQLTPGSSSAGEVASRYGSLLQLQPATPRLFTVRFEANSSRLNADADAVLAQVRQALASMPAPEVVVTGHTDRVGSLEANDRLSLARANVVRDILVAAGVGRALITVAGRGEREPLVPTADEVAEAANRRVEIKIR